MDLALWKIMNDLGCLPQAEAPGGFIREVLGDLTPWVTGYHLWADRYDRDLKDVFALQDEITIKIISALRVKLTDGEIARVTARGTQNLEAYLKVLQAQDAFLNRD